MTIGRFSFPWAQKRNVFPSRVESLWRWSFSGAFVNSWAALIEPVAVYNCRLDPTRLPVEFIFRAFPLGYDTASEHQDRPDGRRFKQAGVCCGCFEHRSRGGHGGERLPTVFNLAATRLAFRAGDEDTREAGGLSHCLNIELRRYPQASVQQFTEVFFQTAHRGHIFLFFSIYRPPGAFNVTVAFVLLPREPLSPFHSFCFIAMKQQKNVSHFGLDYIWSRWFLSLMLNVKHMCFRAQSTLCLFLSIAVDFSVQSCQAYKEEFVSKSCFAWWGLEYFTIIDVFPHYCFSLVQHCFKNRRILVVFAKASITVVFAHTYGLGFQQTLTFTN